VSARIRPKWPDRPAGEIEPVPDLPEALAARGVMAFDAGKRISVTLSGDDNDTLSGYYEKLSAGGTGVMPLNVADWGDKFGMFTDKFGVSWMVNISLNK